MTERMQNDTLAPAGLTRRGFGRRAATWVFAGGTMAVLAACGSGKPAKSAAKKTTKSAHDTAGAAHSGDAAAHGAAHWDYEGVGGPDRWSELAPENALCSAGSTQSPIDIAGTQPGLLGRTSIKWQSAPLNVVNNGHTIQADVANGGAIEIDGVPYTLVQFHFHAPSEHTVDGKRFALETHFVHKNAKGDLAVIGVLHDTGAANNALAPVWAALPGTTDERKELPKFDLAAVLPQNRSMYRYAGSLTTPPCTEGVRWHVLQTPTTVSEAQVKAFNAIIKLNARPVQPLKARDLLKESL